jgi:hypothetical protein
MYDFVGFSQSLFVIHAEADVKAKKDTDRIAKEEADRIAKVEAASHQPDIY